MINQWTWSFVSIALLLFKNHIFKMINNSSYKSNSKREISVIQIAMTFVLHKLNSCLFVFFKLSSLFQLYFIKDLKETANRNIIFSC